MAKMKNKTLRRMIERGLAGPFSSDDFKLGFGSFLRGDINFGKKVRIGHGTNILADKGSVTLADKVIIGSNVTIDCEDGEVDIGHDVRIKSGSRLGTDIKIEEECELGYNTIIEKNAYIGKRNKFSNCTIASPAQDLRDRGCGKVIIGDDNKITEYVVINRGTSKDGGKTIIGSGNNIFSQVHIAHDCIIGDNTEIITMTGLAGHVHVGNYARISGKVGVAPWVHIGECAFIYGDSGVGDNVLPYSRVGGRPASLQGINFERLRRLHKASYKKVYGEIWRIYDQIISNRDLPDDDLLAFLRSCRNEYADNIAGFIKDLSPRKKEMLRFIGDGGKRK